MVNVLRIHPDGDVVMATRDLAAGTPLDLGEGQPSLGVSTITAIPFGHKIAIHAMAAGQHVIKYGASIGVASQAIAPGEHVHAHNLVTVRGRAAQQKEVI